MSTETDAGVSAEAASERRDNPSALAVPMLPPDPASPGLSDTASALTPPGVADTPSAPAPGFSPTLRAATAADLDAISAIETAVFEGDAWSRDVMAAELTGEHRAYLVLEGEGGAILGYGGLLAVGSDGDIQTIALAPAARGAGHGRRMMNALLDEAERRSVREVFLEVRADNTVAHSLYLSLGFEQLGVRPRYYQPDDVDAIVMRLNMGEQK